METGHYEPRLNPVQYNEINTTRRNFKLRAREFHSWPIGGSSVAGSKKQVVVYVGTDNLHSNLLLTYQPL
ncbi:hypothetical protein E2C01_037888 [Portunus trituberculatus]|uniref:Uncharacterized protein n=1 Tax=Portunus trituberculatus TaxID=210409 RepID=A0A5B7FCP1_PORTR|nr:hypothetical protein [Portunus trituberculatus]